MVRLLFGEFVLDLSNALLLRGEERVALPPKPFGVLCYLVERAGSLVSKDELLDAVWANLHVTESSLSVSINALRLALGDDSKAPRFIETAPRRGYRFIAPVSAQSSIYSEASPVASPLTPRAALRTNWRVGRESALATVEGWFEQAAWGRRQTVFVTGEGGIGKTTFAGMLAERLADRDLGVLAGRCIEHFGTDEAFLPLNEALSDACAGPAGPLVIKALREHAPTWLAQLPGLIAGRNPSALKNETFGASRERMLREFCELVEALSRDRPWLILIEDLHWSDYATLDVISRFAQRAQPAAAMVIATYRPIDVVLGGHPTRAVHQELQIHGRCQQISLDKLSRAEVERHLELRLGDAELARSLAPMVTLRTGGHPLFVVSLVDYFIDQGEIVEMDGGWRLAPGKSVSVKGMPGDIHEMIARQIDRLQPEEQRLLEAASAVGAEVSAAAVAGAMNMTPDDAELALEDLARKGQALAAAGVAEWPDGTVSGRYVFLHALYQEVLYGRLAPGRRASTHRQIGATLERGYGARTSEIAAVLALHFEEGRDFARAIRYLGEAADSSIKRFSNQEAVTYLTRALGLVDQLPAGEDRLTARLTLLNKRGWARRSAGDLPGSLGDLSIVVACAAEAGETKLEVAGLMDLSRFGLYVERSRLLDLAQQAVARSRTLDDDVLKALVLGNSSNLRLLLEGWSAEQAEICFKALRATAASKDPHIVLRRCSIDMVMQYLTSNYRACCVQTATAQAMAQAIGDVYLFAIYNMLEAFAYWQLGEWRIMRQSLAAAIAMCRRNANRQAAALGELAFAWLHAEAFDYAGATRRAEAVLDDEIEKNPFNFFLARNLLFKAAIGRRDFDEAARQLKAIRRKIDVEGVPMDSSFHPQHLLNVFRYWFAIGDLPRAKEAALRLDAYVTPQRELTYKALSHWSLGKVAWIEGDVAAAGSHFAQGVEIVDGAEVPLAAWRLYLAAAQWHESRGGEREAQAMRAKMEAVIDRLAGCFDEGDPLGPSLLANYETDAASPFSLEAPPPSRVPPLDGRSSHGEGGSTTHKP